jgi:hypothetical protein
VEEDSSPSSLEEVSPSPSEEEEGEEEDWAWSEDSLVPSEMVES